LKRLKLMVSLLREPIPECALAIAAHPDDIEFMAGGTLASWIAQGCQVHSLIVTDGAGGSRDPEQDPAQLIAQRRQEQLQAAAILGVASVTFLGYGDATLEPTRELRLALARVIRQVRPEAVLSFDPHMLYRAATINHSDHLAVGASTLGAVMPLANTWQAAPELQSSGLLPHDVSTIYLFEPASPTHWMPLSPHAIDQKAAALRAHASQLANWDGVHCLYERARATAQIARQQGIRCAYAEDFTRIQLAPDGQYTGRPWSGATLQAPRIGLLAKNMKVAAAHLVSAIQARMAL
jgi:LmbE family N-acetylglucosaminyl deacetylase